jgi:hypothetical protein
MILKLSIYLSILSGEKIIYNYRQMLPYERISNLAFFPLDNAEVKKKTNKKKKTMKGNEKEEYTLKLFNDRIEKEKARYNLSFCESETEKIGSVFFNKVKFYIHEKRVKRPQEFKPFKNQMKNKFKDLKFDRLNVESPESIPAERKEKISGVTNYAKFLKKQYREELDKCPIVQKIEQFKRTGPGNRPTG